MESNNTHHHHDHHQCGTLGKFSKNLRDPFSVEYSTRVQRPFRRRAAGDGRRSSAGASSASCRQPQKPWGLLWFLVFFGTILSLSVSKLMCVFFFHNKCNCFLVVYYVWKGMRWGRGWRNIVHDVTYGFVCLWSQLELESESELGGWKCIISTLTLLTFYASPKSWNVKPSYHGGSSTLRAQLPPSVFPLLPMSNLIFVAWLSLTHIWDQSVTLLIVLCSWGLASLVYLLISKIIIIISLYSNLIMINV